MASISIELFGRKLRRGLKTSPATVGVFVLLALIYTGPTALRADGVSASGNLPPGAVSQFVSGSAWRPPEMFSADAKLLRIQSRVWEVETGRCVIAPDDLADRKYLEFTSDGGMFLCVLSRGSATWRLVYGKTSLAKEQSVTVVGTPYTIRCAGELLAGISPNTMDVDVWDVLTREKLATVKSVEVQSAVVYGAAPFSASPDLSTLACPWGEKGLLVWNLAKGKVMSPASRVELQSESGATLVYSDDGSRFAVPTRNNESIDIFDAATAALVRTVPGAAGPLLGEFDRPMYRFSPDGQSIFVAPSRLGIFQSPICQYELATGRELSKTRIRDLDALARFACSAEGLLLLGQPPQLKRAIFDELRTPPLRLATRAPDARLVACCGTGDTISVWEGTSQAKIGEFHPPGTPSCPLISPDGRRLATHVRTPAGDHVIVWDLTFGASAQAGSARQLSDVWANLASPDGLAARKAIWEMVFRGDEAVSFIDREIHVATVDEAHVRHLISDLDSDLYAVRHSAFDELKKTGSAASPALLDRSKQSTSLETRSLIQELLRSFDAPISDPSIQQDLRAIEVLDHIGTEAARHVLARIANGTGGARVTVASRAAIERIGPRTKASHLPEANHPTDQGAQK